MSRALDILASSIGLVLLSPIMLAAGVGIKLSDHGPVLHRARRVGKGGELFEVYKFRTMVRNADMAGPGITASGDARITAIGRLLRRSKIDELPQLLNVLMGDMSLVGPRPEDPRYVALYTGDQREILSVRPGVTSLASIRYRNEEELLRGDDWETVYRERVLPDKIAIELQYVRSRSLWTDLSIIARTLLALFR